MFVNLKKIIIFFVVSIISVGLVFVFTTTDETFEALSGLNFSFLIILSVLWAATLFIEALSLKSFVCGTGESLGLWLALKFIALKNFFNIITPMNSGGTPFLIFALSKEGISPGKASSAVLMKVISKAAISFIGVVIIIFFFRRYITDISYIKSLFFIMSILFILLTGLALFAMLSPRFLITIITGLTNILHKLKVIKITHNFKKKVIHEAYYARKSFRQYFRSHFFYFLAGNIWVFIYHLLQIVVLYIILFGLGIHLPVLKGIVLSTLQQAFIAFQPTPGGAGFGEGIFVLLFKGTVPVYLLGIAIILWRLFTQYLTAIFGAVLSGSYIQVNSLRKPVYQIKPKDKYTNKLDEEKL